MDLLKFLDENAFIIATIAGALLTVSESLPHIDRIKANSVGQLVLGMLRFLARKK